VNLLRPLRKLHKLRKLPLARSRDLVRAQFAVLAAGRTVRKTALGELVAVADAAGATIVDLDQRVRSEHIAWSVVQVATHGVVPATCLVRSVAIQQLLVREGLSPGEIRVGVKWDDGGFFAHAWIEQDEHILGDTLQHVRQFDLVTDMRLVNF